MTHAFKSISFDTMELCRAAKVKRMTTKQRKKHWNAELRNNEHREIEPRVEIFALEPDDAVLFVKRSMPLVVIRHDE